jgi:DNA-binding transcriptional ArsR family regulator
LPVKVFIPSNQISVAGVSVEMLNEASLVERELTLRDLRITNEVMETRRSIVRWLALSLGVISPGESRLSAISVLDAMLYFSFKEKREPQVSEILTYISNYWSPMNEKTVRYHLLQLKKMGIVSNSKGNYTLIWPDVGDRYDAEAWINSYIDRGIEPIKNKVRLAIKELKTR